MPNYKAHAVIVGKNGKVSEPDTGVVEIDEELMGATAILGLSLLASLTSQGFEPEDIQSFFIEKITEDTNFWESN